MPYTVIIIIHLFMLNFILGVIFTLIIAFALVFFLAYVGNEDREDDEKNWK